MSNTATRARAPIQASQPLRDSLAMSRCVLESRAALDFLLLLLLAREETVSGDELDWTDEDSCKRCLVGGDSLDDRLGGGRVRTGECGFAICFATSL